MRRRTRLAAGAGELSLTLDRGVRYLTANLLWALVSMTVVGLPAATVALHEVVREWAAGDERPVVARYLAALRRTWRAATALGVGAAAVAALFLVNVWVAPLMGAQARPVVVAVVAVTLPVLLYVAVLPAAVADTGTARQALAVAGRRLVATPLLAVAGLGLAAVTVAAALAFPPSLLLVPAAAVRADRALLQRFHLTERSVS